MVILRGQCVERSQLVAVRLIVILRQNGANVGRALSLTRIFRHNNAANIFGITWGFSGGHETYSCNIFALARSENHSTVARE